ncbi:expressed unknown protein [Seminavis robusta]|uniref:Uncharacterized protein n=1 Tax=Seminavis robusta TaxID=568900 RepID=A0A9N8DDB6_9STRA|nr:expressed unknown protein [Seminavis robusta]|eukprot:Sro86_g045640.1 n/a (223) ;mRNA; f:34951-35619
MIKPVVLMSLALLLLVCNVSVVLAKKPSSSSSKKTGDGPPPQPCQKYLDMSDEDLFFSASEGRRIGDHCRIKNSPSASCDYYVVAEPSATTGYDGWPRTFEDRGRGCVYHPDGKGKCGYQKMDYRHWDETERTQMCAGNYVQNAAAQLRHAILNDRCGGSCSLPQCHHASHETTRPYCYHCRKCKDNMEHCKEGYKFCKLCKEECPSDYEKGEVKRTMGDEL